MFNNRRNNQLGKQASKTELVHTEQTAPLAPTHQTVHFVILILAIISAGLSQGMLLPVLAIFLEKMGVSSTLNGLNAAVLYVGSFAMTLMAERLVGKLGFKKLMLLGLLIVMIALPLFPLVPGVAFWFVLRLLVGIGDSAIHYVAQLWVLMVTAPENRGRNLSIYGISYGIGFSIGPLGISLLDWGMAAPFLLMTAMFMIVALLVWWKLPSGGPGRGAEVKPEKGRFARSYRLAWYALIPALLYGYMEAAMNSNFPVYGLRTGLSTAQIAFLLPFIGVGGLMLQLPLGILSDRWGRKRVLMLAGALGGVLFMLVPFAGTRLLGIALLFAVAGGLVGSFFSLGLAYAADVLPRTYLPAANVLASFHFNFGSIVGPAIGGRGIELGSAASLFWVMGGCYVIFALLGLLFRQKQNKMSA
ncbi:MFS transporter [Paenibacillus campi]|uniref:MFS transporter n=1 Tax=Paenibacillus campi TaxID=3106031 RepID=UPI002AFF7C55|nr:MFS transporter [Paenibacillus sp. SGZ-1014]